VPDLVEPLDDEPGEDGFDAEAVLRLVGREDDGQLSGDPMELSFKDAHLPNPLFRKEP
jgi:hypothetical protein